MKSFQYFLQITTIITLLQFLHHQQQKSDAATITNNTNNQTICSPSSCGEIKNISYPFRLKDDPTTCGNQRYELSCEKNRTKLMLHLFSGKYYVKSINYNNYTIRLVDPAIKDSDCSSLPMFYLYTYNFTTIYSNNGIQYDPYQNFQQRIIPASNIYEEAIHMPLFQHIIYMNCNNRVINDPVYADTYRCIKRNSSSQSSHFYAIVGDLKVGDFKYDDCHVELAAAISYFGYNKSRFLGTWEIPNRKFLYSEIHRMLVGGFELSWMSAPCEDVCGNGNPFCYLREIDGKLECNDPADQCITTLGFHVNCASGRPSKLRMFIEGFTYGTARGFTHAIGVTIDDGAENVDESQLGINIGRIFGRYILSTYIFLRFMLGFIVFFAKMIHIYRTRHSSMYENIEDFLQGNTLVPIRYSYKEIKNMTRGFKDKLGEGGYGKVYKGKLRSGPFVAIKMMNQRKGNGSGQDFISEVATIGRIHHTNVVRLVGFCVEGSKRALVYDFMPNGSLDKYISSEEDHTFLTYKQMYEISLGVARGIAYLHQGCDMQILHFDIKPHNILLDENFVAKVSDFGLAKLYPVDNSIVPLTAARGTIGYMAPELFYKNIGGVSYKADVYSFGMLLMEIANRRRNLNSNTDNSSQIFFPFWIYNQLIEKRELEILGEATDEEKKNVKKMFMVALWCIQLRPTDRPSMDKVIEMLEGDIENIQIPPEPSPYPNEVTHDHETSSSESISDEDVSGSISFLKETAEDPLLK